MNLVRSILTVSGFTLLSRVFGFIRDMLFAAFLGAGPVADAFFVAFKMPNLFRRLFAEGAFNAAFVPLFAGKVEADGRVAAIAYARVVFGVLLWTLLVFVAAIEVAMPWVITVFYPGFLDTPDRFDMAVLFTRIAFPYLLFISLVSLAAGVLNSLGRFAAAAATPILLNFCLIGALLGLAPLTETPGHALAIGVAIAGVAQLIWLMVHAARAGAALWPARPRLSPDVKTTLARIVPGAVGAGVYQLNLVIDMAIASLLPIGSISYLYYADRVTQLPLGVIGVAVGTALLPVLSRQLRAGNTAAAMDSQNRALEFTLFFTIPAAAALIVIAEPIVTVLFQRGQFDPVVATATAGALAAYAIGLPAYVLNKSLTPSFFARGDTKTPVKAAAVSLVVNFVLNLVLMGPLAHVGIALASAIAAWTNTVILAVILHRRGAWRADPRLKAKIPRLIAVSAVMAVVLWAALQPLLPWFAATEGPRTVALAGLVVGGFLLFMAMARVAGVATLAEVKSALRRK